MAKKRGAKPPPQNPLPGVADPDEVNKATHLESENLKRAGKVAMNARLAIEKAMDEIRDIVADGTAAPTSCEKAIEHLARAAEKVQDAQKVLREGEI